MVFGVVSGWLPKTWERGKTTQALLSGQQASGNVKALKRLPTAFFTVP